MKRTKGYCIFSMLLIWLLMAGCARRLPEPEAASALPPAFRYQPMDLLLHPEQAGKVVTTAGYYYANGEGEVLVIGLSFSGGEQPLPVGQGMAEQLWLEDLSNEPSSAALREAGDVRFAPVLAEGWLEGPGDYGPGGRYSYQLVAAKLTSLTALDLTVPALLEKSFSYDGQFVRISGALLARPDSALLVERLGDGGLPPPDTRQIKLLPPFRDRALWERLAGGSGGVVRYGAVQVEGFWKEGALLTLGIIPITST